MPLHPDVAALLAGAPTHWRDPDAIAQMTAARARALAGEAIARAGDAPPPAGIVLCELDLPGAAGPLRARVHHPREGASAGAVLWIHGGGFIFGAPEADRLPPLLARAASCAVVSLDYRLAPEHPFPAGLEDCYAALEWMAAHTAALAGGEAGPVAVGGVSAGGNLAASVALLARERGAPRIALQVLLAPMLARAFDAPSRRDPEIGAEASAEAIEWLWRQYLGDREGSDPLACPLTAETLAGLPPALVITAEYDVLRDEGEAYARRLEHDGVPVELRRYDGMHHSFADCAGAIDAADECIEQMGAAFRRALAVGENAWT